MSIISVESADKIPEGFLCPIAASSVMGDPIHLPCCKATIDAESLLALLKRLPASAETLTCPLCRWQMDLEKDVSRSAKSLIHKVTGVIQNQDLKLRIDEWVRENPDVRRQLLIDSNFYGEPIASDGEGEDTIPDVFLPSRVPGLLEALSRMAPCRTGSLTFGPEFTIEAESTDPLHSRRDFLVTFNMIWQEMPYELRPEPFIADSQKELHEKVLAWLDSSASDEALSSIETLNLQSLDLLSLPLFTTRLSNLTCLDVSKNSLKALPNIPSLKWMNARRNRIVAVDSSVLQMQNLETLFLAKNPIVSVSSKLASLPKMKRLELTQLDEHFEGLPIEFVDCGGKVDADMKYNKRLVRDVVAEVEAMLNMGVLLRLKDFQKASKVLERLTPYMQYALTQNTSLLMEQLVRPSSEDECIKLEAVHLTSLFYIIWLYWQKNDGAAEKLFLKLPIELRNEVYGLIYHEIAPKLSSRKKLDPEVGKKVFHGVPGFPEIAHQARLNAITVAGDNRVKKLKAQFSRL